MKADKVCIQKVIGFGWVQIWKGKLCGRTLKTYRLRDKPNLNNIFKSHLGYCDLESLRNSLYYFKRLWKFLFAIIQQLGPPTFFVIFISIENLWDFFIKTLHTLCVWKLNPPNIIENLQFVHITKLIRIDPLTCVRYYNHRTSYFTNLSQKIIIFLGIFVKAIRH